MKLERVAPATLQERPLWSPAIDPPATLPPPPLSRLALWPQTLTLFAQTLGLTILTLLSAIIITVIVIFNLPPPMPDFYRVADIAQVLKTGRPFTGAERPPLVRTISNAPPVGAESVRGDMMYLTRQELAHRLNTDPQDVLVMMDSPRFTDRKAVALIRGQMARAGPGQDRFLIAPFMVSVKQPNGQWFSVAPTPSFKLSAWQSRLLLWLGLSLLALIPLAYLFSLRLSSPIAAFAAAAERLGRDPRAPPLAIKGPSEIGVAVKAVNEMQQRLARYVDDRTAMIGAIAHDLRTPLTRLRFRLEDAPDPVRRKMAADISEMEAMIAAAIAFVRDATTPTARTKLELSSLLESLADEMSETGLDVVVDVSERVVIDGDPVGLRRLFNNLLGNAVKFAGGARVRVTAGVEAAVVEIEDDGLGLPENELERVFEPFYRCEQSRSRESGGIGLGLPVVRSIARAHGGDAVLSNRPTHGLIATVTLPLAGV